MKVGRFQVMAALQAARAKELGLPIRSAKSWGLNRAIFYAAAKRGFKERKLPRREREEIRKRPVKKVKDVFFLGDEMAYVSKKGRISFFTIGGELQRESDFKRQIESRFGASFPEAWKESLEIIRQYPRDVLLSQSEFFEQVYKPRRDELADRWTKMSRP